MTLDTIFLKNKIDSLEREMVFLEKEIDSVNIPHVLAGRLTGHLPTKTSFIVDSMTAAKTRFMEENEFDFLTDGWPAPETYPKFHFFCKVHDFPYSYYMQYWNEKYELVQIGINKKQKDIILRYLSLEELRNSYSGKIHFLNRIKEQVTNGGMNLIMEILSRKKH